MFFARFSAPFLAKGVGSDPFPRSCVDNPRPGPTCQGTLRPAPPNTGDKLLPPTAPPRPIIALPALTGGSMSIYLCLQMLT